jgi:hypothetical protein
MSKYASRFSAQRVTFEKLVTSLAVVLAACSVETPLEPADPATGGGAGVSGSSGVAGNLTGGAGAGSGGASVAGNGGSAGGAGGSGGSAGGSGSGQSGGSGAGGAPFGGSSGAGGAAAGMAGMDGAGAGGAAAGMAGTAGTSDGGSGSGAGGMAGQGGGAAGAGAAGKSGSGGSGGATGFAPCPTTGACKILPLGDSITDGIGYTGGYRVELFSLALADGHDVTFVGGSMNGPQMVDGQPFPRSHEGHSGWTVSQIDGIVPSPALNPDPHIILLHIGTNDMYQMPSGATDRLETLIDAILTELPNSLLVVSNIIPLPQSAGAVTTYNAPIPGMVMERANAGKHILFVNQFEGFPTSELGDGVHPNQVGYERMARKWYAAISDYL